MHRMKKKKGEIRFSKRLKCEKEVGSILGFMRFYRLYIYRNYIEIAIPLTELTEGKSKILCNEVKRKIKHLILIKIIFVMYIMYSK